MTRLELLKLATGRARLNGFNFRRWYTTRLALPWISNEAALQLLDAQRRYYSLLFSHEFASSFWKAGEDITFKVPAQTFNRVMPDGTVQTVSRKPYIRRSARPDVWRYHLQKMAVSDDPLRYLRKYLHLEEELEPEAETATTARPGLGRAVKKAARKPGKDPRSSILAPRAPGLPSFLKRPYGQPNPEP
jgi:hypothetical protein